ncbi:hypothetical protein [Oceanospirillum sanctuarii]|uniref:hypothetical protein n=1 Tax=Oceanospirillum sanctuarii TaxID=1434821 RepID=UPI000A37811D|nr:hypothetical protein [Oceanospirillum sanctuarii]
MNKVKKILAVSALSLSASTVSAKDGFQLSVGNLSYDMAISSSIPSLSYSYSTTASDSGGILGLGFITLKNDLYSGFHLYIPNTDDDAFMLEGSSQMMLSDNLYAGAFGGYFNWVSKDPNSSLELDFSGFSLGLSAGLLLLDDKLDISAKYRVINGSTVEIRGNSYGYSYSSEAEIDTTFQMTVGYNFGF